MRWRVLGAATGAISLHIRDPETPVEVAVGNVEGAESAGLRVAPMAFIAMQAEVVGNLGGCEEVCEHGSYGTRVGFVSAIACVA